MSILKFAFPFLIFKMLVLALLIFFSYDFEKFSEESRLVAFLQERYLRAGQVARPVRNSSQNLRIEFALVLIQILDFDETNQVLTTNVWKRYVSTMTMHLRALLTLKKIGM